MKIFVTGGTGFIGKHLVKKLEEKGHVLRLLSCNLADCDKWKKEIEGFEPEAVVHLAWEGLPDYSIEQSRKNIDYTFNLFSFLANTACKTILSVGSAWEKGGRFPESAIAGTILDRKPTDVFSAAKWIANLWGTAIVEEKNREFFKKREKKFIWARIFFVYGPGQRQTSLIPYLLNCVKNNEIPKIRDLSAKNDFIYIDDVTKAIVLLLEKCQESGEYDIGSGKLVSNKEIIDIISRKLNIKNWQKEAANSENNSYFPIIADIKGLNEMDWQPNIAIEQGLERMINYYLDK